VYEPYIFAGFQNYSSGGNGGVHYSTNNGANWTTVNYSASCMATNGVELYAGTSGGAVLKSTDNGYTFTPTTIFTGNAISSIVAVGTNIVAATNTVTGVYVSTNKGITWTQKNEGFTGYISIRQLTYLNGYVFAGSVITVWRRLLSNLVGIENIGTETPSSFSLGQNYPNPFNNTSNLKFEIANFGNVKILVYDITGRLIKTLVNEELQPGSYEVSFDGSGLNSGVYFYRLETKGFSVTKRMVLLK
jgi:hypothetical protein